MIVQAVSLPELSIGVVSNERAAPCGSALGNRPPRRGHRLRRRAGDPDAPDGWRCHRRRRTGSVSQRRNCVAHAKCRGVPAKSRCDRAGGQPGRRGSCAVGRHSRSHSHAPMPWVSTLELASAAGSNAGRSRRLSCSPETLLRLSQRAVVRRRGVRGVRRRRLSAPQPLHPPQRAVEAAAERPGRQRRRQTQRASRCGLRRRSRGLADRRPVSDGLSQLLDSDSRQRRHATCARAICGKER